jgi:hypothetical protein
LKNAVERFFCTTGGISAVTESNALFYHFINSPIFSGIVPAGLKSIKNQWRARPPVYKMSPPANVVLTVSQLFVFQHFDSMAVGRGFPQSAVVFKVFR